MVHWHEYGATTWKSGRVGAWQLSCAYIPGADLLPEELFAQFGKHDLVSQSSALCQQIFDLNDTGRQHQTQAWCSKQG